MKKALLIAALSVSVSGIAQITINSSHLPNIGDQLDRATDTMPSVSAGAAGTNQTYTFTGLNQHLAEQITFTNPSWTPAGSSFSGSNLAAYFGTSGQTAYMLKSSSSMQLIGLAGDIGFGPMVIKNANPETIIELPLDYNDTYTDVSVIDSTVSGAAVGQASFDSIRLKQQHNRTYLVDGWGSATTPTGTYDVLRQKDTDIQTDSIWGKLFGTWTLLTGSIDTNYRYSFWTDDPTAKFPLIELSVDEFDNVEEVSWISTATAPTTVKEEVKLTVGIYPNPVDEVLFVENANSIDAYEILDVTGKRIDYDQTSALNTVNVKNLKPGVYFLSIYKNKDKQTLRFLKK